MRERAMVLGAATAMLVAGWGSSAQAQSATQLVTYEVQAINQISVADASKSLTISTATAGSAPTSATCFCDAPSCAPLGADCSTLVPCCQGYCGDKASSATCTSTDPTKCTCKPIG